MTPDQAMDLAIEEARLATVHGDVPVGAVLLDPNGVVLSRRHNERELRRDPLAHAELLVLSEGAAALRDWRLTDTTLVVTLEPCAMCAGALIAARVGHLVYGAADLKAGACGSLYNLCDDPRLNHRVEVAREVRAAECGELLSAFFAQRRDQ